ncbi:hypothetical protein O181_010268 [Austropuccinia psidii MF-1]|uniref:Uncharacterized protein n=1 Tax=Austropuccinia psidii MF-1 TaxID=1389203 RepID=A0A9Q3BSN5_9BASI|nr:hypothetical protein [Austropuccinia psidii MF-1]
MHHVFGEKATVKAMSEFDLDKLTPIIDVSESEEGSLMSKLVPSESRLLVYEAQKWKVKKGNDQQADQCTLSSGSVALDGGGKRTRTNMRDIYEQQARQAEEEFKRVFGNFVLF